MINLAVVKLRGAPAAHGVSAHFGSAGGTIGRADTNTLVLDDPDRTVSRIHAQVLCRGEQFFIVDRGSNPLVLNGTPLGSGREAPLADGDRLSIGSFELTVRSAGAATGTPTGAPTALPAALAATDDDPFADLLAGLGPPAPPAAAMPQGPAGAAGIAESGLPDPFAAGGRGAATEVDPFADLLAPAPREPAVPPPGAGALDDFSDLAAPSAGKAAGIDALFGGVGDIGGGLGGDPLALSPLADPLLQPNTSGAVDPLAALQGVAPVAPAARSDHLPIDHFGFVPPNATAEPLPPSLLDDLGPATGGGAAFDDMTGLPIAPPPAPPPSPVAPPPASAAPTLPPLPAADAFASLGIPAPAPVPAPVPVQAPAAPRPLAAAGGGSADALLAAFLQGLGSTHQAPQALTPELMLRLGTLLRSATEGTLQLLLTRQEFKREVRAEVTMIAAQANNPLKFSPTAEVALAHLLGPGMRGFMPAEEAMRDAYDDLRAHQFGVMVGMRAALAHVIERFAPAELEKKIAAKSALDSLFSANRKAKLWDQFIALYGGIASEAEDDFHALFGKAFLQAYEEQMARLKSDG